jgi:hypothetical protein
MMSFFHSSHARLSFLQLTTIIGVPLWTPCVDVVGTRLAEQDCREVLTMKKLLRSRTISGLSLIAMSFAIGCSTTKEETTRTTTYVPATEVPAPVVVTPPPRVVVNPAPVVVTPPAANSTTTSTTVEKKTDSRSSEYSPYGTTERSQSSYHSETSTVSP